MAELNGKPHDFRTPEQQAAEAVVLASLPLCSAEFLGWLKIDCLSRIQRQLRGIQPSGELGTHVAFPPQQEG